MNGRDLPVRRDTSVITAMVRTPHPPTQAVPTCHSCFLAFLLTYDITSEDSFTQVKRIKAEIEKELNKASGVYIAVAAMKTDLEEQVKK